METKLGKVLSVLVLLAAGQVASAAGVAPPNLFFVILDQADQGGGATDSLLVDTGISANTLANNPAAFEGWMIDSANQTVIADFLTGRDIANVIFNGGGTLLGQDAFETFGYVATRSSGTVGTQIPVNDAGVGSIVSKIGAFSDNAAVDPVPFATSDTGGTGHFSNINWGESLGGSVGYSTAGAPDVQLLTTWTRLNGSTFIPEEAALGYFLLDSATGKVSFSENVIPVPAAVWLFGSALGMLGWIRRRMTRSA